MMEKTLITEVFTDNVLTLNNPASLVLRDLVFILYKASRNARGSNSKRDLSCRSQSLSVLFLPFSSSIKLKYVT